MNWKLTYKEFSAMHDLLQEVIVPARPKGFEATVLHGVLLSLYKKFYTKAFSKKKKYSVPVTDAEACAFYMFFSKYQMTQQNVFTMVLVLKTNNKIHKLFSHENTIDYNNHSRSMDSSLRLIPSY